MSLHGISHSHSQSPAVSSAPTRSRPLPIPNSSSIRTPVSGDSQQYAFVATRFPAVAPEAALSSLPPSTVATATNNMQASGTTDESLRQSVLGLTLQSSPRQGERTLNSSRSASPQNDQIGQIDVDPTLVAPRPTISSLQRGFASIQSHDASQEKQVAWIQDVLFLVYRTYLPPPDIVSVDPEMKKLDIDDPALTQLASSAVELLLTLVPSVPSAGTKLAPPIAEALQIRASLTQSGIFSAYINQDPRKAFRAFEASARAENHAAWFNLGRCYEVFKDARRAKDCYERGLVREDVKCLYRMGLAHLMGQLGIEASPTIALPLLFRAAEKATVAAPQPAYVFGCLLRGDFAHTSAVLPKSLFESYIPTGSSIEEEALKHISRAAYLHYTPAQYKLGYYYESEEAYDPLLSVQYYTLASEVEPEAFLALSKWFLCGAEGLFEKDESLARTCAEQAAQAGVVNAEFAVGYYWEVGIGSDTDLRRAKKWYEKAAANGNLEAAERLSALAQNEQASFSRQDHEKLAQDTLVRRRTQAKQRFEASRSVRRAGKRENPDKVVELARKASKVQPRGERRRRAERKSIGLDATSDTGSDTSGEAKGNTPYANAYSSVDSVVERASRSSDGSRNVEGSPERRSRENTLAPPVHYPERKRYSLVDPGPTSRSSSPFSQPRLSDNDRRGDGTMTPPLRHGSPSPRTPRTGSEARSSVISGPSDRDRSTSSSGIETPGSAPEDSNERRVRYSTFEEMGIKPSKIEGKDCIIM